MPVAWEFQTPEGTWTPYYAIDGAMLEKQFKAGNKKFSTTDLSFNKEFGTIYKFDLTAMLQVNSETGTKKKLRRIDLGIDDEEGDDVAFMKVSSMISSGVAPPMIAPTKDEAPDEPPKKKVKESKPWAPPSMTSADVAEQRALGAQSLRMTFLPKMKLDFGPAIMKDPHGTACFNKMIEREKHLCDEWAVFYHSYSFAALLYEVQAAVAHVLFRFQSQYGTLPRLLKQPFLNLPDAEALQKLFPKLKARDHDPTYRSVAISATSSCVAEDSEAPPKRIFLQGYSCSDLSFLGTLESLLESCAVPKPKVSALAKEIVAVSGKYGLDVRQFGGKGCGSGRAGHMLQIFVKRPLVDKYVYPAFPYGVPDAKRHPLAAYLAGPGPIDGQVRIVVNPSVFMRGNAVRMHVYSADPTFHGNRGKFQEEMTALLDPIIGAQEVRTKAAQGIYGGEVPSWFHADDHENQKKLGKA